MKVLLPLLFVASAAADNFQYISLIQFTNTSTEVQQAAAVEGLQKSLASNPTAGKNIKAWRGMKVEKASADMATVGVFETMDKFKAYHDSKERKEINAKNDAISAGRVRAVFTGPDVKLEAPATGKLRRTCAYTWKSNTTAADAKGIMEAFKANVKTFPKVTYFILGENVAPQNGKVESGLGMVQDWPDKAAFEDYYNSTGRSEFSKKYIKPNAEMRQCATYMTTMSGTRKYLRYD